MAHPLIKKFFIDPPVLFPLAAVFHLFLLVRAIVDFSGEPMDSPVWHTALWYGAAAALMIFICLLRRWALFGYIALTAAGLLMQYFLPAGTPGHDLGLTLFPFDVLVTIFLFFFYKRFH